MLRASEGKKSYFCLASLGVFVRLLSVTYIRMLLSASEQLKIGECLLNQAWMSQIRTKAATPTTTKF